jgi:hypothetical protein
MKMRRMMAVKPHKYGTRHLTAGEEYEVPPRHALALLASKKARYAAEASPRPPGKSPTQSLPPAQMPEPVVAARLETERDPLDELRAQAHRLGVEVDKRWGTVRLQLEISKVSRETN